MVRLRHVPLILTALARWVLGARWGRWGIGVCAVAVMWAQLGPAPAKTTGEWAGLGNHIAPNRGPIELTGRPGGSTGCTVRGETGYVHGDGWVFKGEARGKETSCEGKIARDGEVKAVLDLEMTWDGRIKGIGGDWEDTSGKASCTGDLSGTLEAGGKWTAKCKREDREWEASFSWKPE